MKLREVVASHWAEIRKVAGGHGVDEIRWWPPTYDIQGSADFLVDGELGSLRELRADLERELGCQVAIYLAHQAPPELMLEEADVEVQTPDDATDRGNGPIHDKAETKQAVDATWDLNVR
jgi:hypothetical protein